MERYKNYNANLKKKKKKIASKSVELNLRLTVYRLGRFWLMICHSTPLDWQLDQFEIKIKVTKEYVKLEREMRDMKCRYILVIN